MRISIITVSYNSETVIRSCIESVLSQDYDNIEYIIIDGNSCDSTIKILESYSGLIDVIVCEPDSGIYDAMNKGIDISSGDIVAFLNSDDFYLSQSIISDVMSQFIENDDVDMILGDVDFVNSENLSHPLRLYSTKNFTFWKMRFGFMPAHPATFCKRKLFTQYGFFDASYKIGADFEWFVRIFSSCYVRTARINKICVRMRVGGVSTSGFDSYMHSTFEQLKALKMNGISSNLIFVLARLPIKYVQRLCYRLTRIFSR